MVNHGVRIVGAAAVALIVTLPQICLAEATRVRVQLDVEGELLATAGRDVAPLRQSITVAGRFDFLETSADDPAGTAVIRRFSEAVATIAVDGRDHESGLAADARVVRVARLGTAAVPSLPDGFLTRDEHDLLDIPFDPLLLEELRSKEVVVTGASWPVSADAAAGLLAIDTIEKGTIDVTLEDVADCRGRLSLSGAVDGAVDGVPTRIVIDGHCTIDVSPDISSNDEMLRYRLEGRISDVNVTLRERRQPGHVAPGFDVEARVSVNQSPIPEDEAIVDAAADVAIPAVRRRGAGQAGVLWYRDAGGRFDLVHDARWRTIAQDPGVLVMRYVDLGALVAQCSITALPPAPADSLPSVEEIQRDISRSLAGQFDSFDGVSRETRDDGVTVVRVVSVGTAESLPFRWVHYVLADELGRRASVAFMMEASMVKRFADADRILVDGIRLDVDPAEDAARAREARLPRKTVTP